MLTCCGNRLHGERQLEQRTLEASSNTYDKQLLSRIGGPNAAPPSKRTSISYASTGSVQETAQLAHAETERRNSQLLRPTLSMPPERFPQPLSLDSPSGSRWPPSGGTSPAFAGFWQEHCPSDTNRAPPSQSQTRHSSLTFDDSISHRGSYDQSMFAQEDLIEDSTMSSLHLHDRPDRSPGSDDCARAGTKRRASSPPREGERPSVGNAIGQGEVYHRRSIQQLPRSPLSRGHPNHSSVSSASSYGPRHGSFGSSLGIASISSSATSYGSGRVSPSALSPAFDSDVRLNAQFANTQALSPNAAVGSASHRRSLSQGSQGGQQISPTASVAPSRNNSVSQLQGVYICECCPKKPRKFEKEEELRLHESEKQYICAYCPNR
jgi:hypothetical protein